MKRQKILVVFGTRPEAIKMCPVIKELRAYDSKFDIRVCVTGQHREMLSQVLQVFRVEPDFDLDVMRPGQSLACITSRILVGLDKVFSEFKPDLVLVHGDTTTSFAAALAAFYKRIPVGHVEAGLRTNDMYSPWPEEFNRQCIDLFAEYYFAPTKIARQNLINEGVSESKIFVTGNTAIDSLKYTIDQAYQSDITEWAQDSRLILITAHRRENLGEPMHNMFRAIRRVLMEHEDVKAVYPIHMNPQVRSIANDELTGIDKLRIIEPLQVVDFHNLMNSSYLILTDSGGIQEEAPSLGKPVLVMRNTTERPEGVSAGTLKLVGTEESDIYQNFKLLLDDIDVYKKMSCASNPYGDGTASQRIVQILRGDSE